MDYSSSCKRCGKCCNEATCLVGDSDIARWKKENRYDIIERLEKYHIWHTISRKDDFCIFYDRKNKKCLIYKTRPESCANFPHSEEAGKKVGCMIFS
ncbi:MAG: YkgJ family cysteine cluster protein [Candidatus Woesearchaeota archaeon]